MKMERTFASIRAYAREDREGKTKSYATCDNSAVVEALFDSGDGVT